MLHLPSFPVHPLCLPIPASFLYRIVIADAGPSARPLRQPPLPCPSNGRRSAILRFGRLGRRFLTASSGRRFIHQPSAVRVRGTKNNRAYDEGSNIQTSWTPTEDSTAPVSLQLVQVLVKPSGLTTISPTRLKEYILRTSTLPVTGALESSK